MADVKLLVQEHSIRQALAADIIIIESVLKAPTGVALTFQDDFTNSGNPVPLSSLFGGGGGGTFDSLTDTPLNKSGAAGLFLRVTLAGNDIEYVPSAGGSVDWIGLTDTENAIVEDRIPFGNLAGTDLIFDDAVRGDHVKTAEPTVSGIIGQFDGELSLVDGTTILVASGSASLVEKVSNTHWSEHGTTWGATNVVIGAPVLANPFGVVLVEDLGFTGSGTPQVVSFATATPTYMRERTKLGYTLHSGGALVAKVDAPDVYKDNSQGVEDIWRAAGIQKAAGTGLHFEIAATLTSEVTASIFTGRGINHRTNPDDSNHLTFPAVPLLSFDTVANDGTVFASAITSFPDTYNNSGVETALTGQRAVVHQVYHIAGLGDFCQLGTTNYQNFDTAAQSLISERVNNPLSNVAQIVGIRHSFVIVAAGATVWASGIAKIFPIIGDSVGAGGVSRWTALSDTDDDDFIGKAGFLSTVNAGETGLELKPPAGAAEVSVPTLSFMASANVVMSATPKIPAWDIVNHVAVDATYFTYPVVGSVGSNEVRIEKKGLYEFFFKSTDLHDSGSFSNPGMGLYVNGVERNGTLAAHAMTSDVTINDKCSGGVCLLDVNDLVTPGFYRFSGSTSIFGGRIEFSLKFLKAED